MGSNDFYPEERPVHEVEVDPFWMDEHPVTVAEFRRFVKATGYVTWAELPLGPGRVPRCRPRSPRSGVPRLSYDPRSGRPDRLSQLVVMGSRELSGATRKALAARSTGVSGTP